MNVSEISDLFDELSNAFQRQGGYGQTDYLVFNEYEKSVYLTMAQQMFVISCYNGKNESGYQFEVTEEDRRILDSLVTTIHPDVAEFDDSQHIVADSVFYRLPPNVMFVVYEQVKFGGTDSCTNGKNAIVVPTTLDEFWKTYKNPFKKPNSRRVLRLDARNNIVELVSDYPISDYFIRYIRKPAPIVLVDLPSDADISVFDGNTAEHGCDLDSQVHPRIVQIAVGIALQSKSIGNNK